MPYSMKMTELFGEETFVTTQNNLCVTFKKSVMFNTLSIYAVLMGILPNYRVEKLGFI